MNKKLILCTFVLLGGAQHAYSMWCQSVPHGDGNDVTILISKDRTQETTKISLLNINSCIAPIGAEEVLPAIDGLSLFDIARKKRYSENKYQRMMGFALANAAYNPKEWIFYKYSADTGMICEIR